MFYPIHVLFQSRKDQSMHSFSFVYHENTPVVHLAEFVALKAAEMDMTIHGMQLEIRSATPEEVVAAGSNGRLVATGMIELAMGLLNRPTGEWVQ